MGKKKRAWQDIDYGLRYFGKRENKSEAVVGESRGSFWRGDGGPEIREQGPRHSESTCSSLLRGGAQTLANLRSPLLSQHHAGPLKENKGV